VFRFLLILLVGYLIWKIIGPYLRKSLTNQFEVRGKKPRKNLDIDPDKIEDAQFKDIDDRDKS